jgi:hypothetical protein
VAFFNYYFNRKKTKALHRNCSDITEFENQQNYNCKSLQHIRLLLTDFAVFGPNHKYLYLLSIKNKELREYIVGKDDFEYAAH